MTSCSFCLIISKLNMNVFQQVQQGAPGEGPPQKLIHKAFPTISDESPTNFRQDLHSLITLISWERKSFGQFPTTPGKFPAQNQDNFCDSPFSGGDQMHLPKIACWGSCFGKLAAIGSCGWNRLLGVAREQTIFYMLRFCERIGDTDRWQIKLLGLRQWRGNLAGNFGLKIQTPFISASLDCPSRSQQTGIYPYPLGAGSARPNPKMGAPDPENPLFPGFSVLRAGIETMVSDHGLGRGQTMG